MVVTGYEFLKRCQPDEISPGIRSVDLTSRIDYYGHLKNYKKKKKKENVLEKKQEKKIQKRQKSQIFWQLSPPQNSVYQTFNTYSKSKGNGKKPYEIWSIEKDFRVLGVGRKWAPQIIAKDQIEEYIYIYIWVVAFKNLI